MAAKGLGVALKLTFSGDNQFGHASTYIFAFTVIFCAVTQINYFNKALDLFSTNRVTPGEDSYLKYFYLPITLTVIRKTVYYVMFTTATIVASVILFNGVKRATAV